MSRWSINTYTFTTVSGSIQFNTLNLDPYLLSGKLVKTLNDTSKVSFSVPEAQGRNLYPGQTLVEVKYGNDRKFFGTVVKKVYNNQNGTYDFEVTGVLGSYQFIPNYNGYDVETIESYIATEVSRFKGTASAPYDCYNPWTELYTGHNEIPSTFGDIETENLGLIPSFNLNLQKTSENAYEFLRMITREKSYLLPSSVTSNKTSLYWYEDGEKAYFKRINGYNTQEVDYDANLISYTYDKRTEATKVFAKNTVEGATPAYGTLTRANYPTPFYFKRVNLAEKSDKSAYSSSDEMLQGIMRLVPKTDYFEAYAYDRHIIDNTVPWFDMGKVVKVNLSQGGEEFSTTLNIVQITYDFVDSSRDRVKLGNTISSLLTSTEEQENEFRAEVKGKLDTSGGTMYGDVVFEGSDSNVETSNTISDDEIHLYRKDNSSSSSARSLESSVDIVPLGLVPGANPGNPLNDEPYANFKNKFGTGNSNYQNYQTSVNGVGLWCENTTSSGTLRTRTVVNPDGVTIVDSGLGASFKSNKLEMRGRIFGTCNVIDQDSLQQGSLNGNGVDEASTTRLVTGFSSEVSGNTTYVWQKTVTGGTLQAYLFEYNANRGFIQYSSLGTSQTTFTTSANTKYIRLLFEYTNHTTITPSAVSNLQVEKGTLESPYTPFGMDIIELTKRAKGWSYKGSLTSSVTTVYFDADDKELMLVPVISNYVFQGAHFVISTLRDTDAPCNLASVFQSPTYYGQTAFKRAGNAITVISNTVVGWSASNLGWAVFARK